LLSPIGRHNSYASETRYAEDQAESIGTDSSAYPGQETGRIPTWSTYTSDQSKQEAIPWSEFALQDHDGQILPDSVTDEELSFQFRQWFTPAKAPLSSERLPCATTGPANKPPPKQGRRSRRKPQNHKRCKRERDNTRNSLRVDEGASNTPVNSAVSPATSSISTNSRGGRQEGYRLSEEDRKNAEGVRHQGACFRCRSLKENVGTIYLLVSAKLRLTVGQSAHMDFLPARIAGGSTSTANSGIG
jgi:hypothetical protein